MASYLLKEDGDYLLKEDGGRILLEPQGVVSRPAPDFAIPPTRKKRKRKKRVQVEAQIIEYPTVIEVVTVALPVRAEEVTYDTFAEELALLVEEEFLLA